jgi:uncharacterized protein (TIGR00369 family)
MGEGAATRGAADAASGGAARDAFGRLLGVETIECGPERVRARLHADGRHHQPYGIVHGGVYCAIVEDVASQGAGHAARAAGQRGVVGVANHTDFLRSHRTGELFAEGTPLHAGRSQHLWQVVIRRASDGAVVARGQVRFHVLDRLPDER